MKTKPGCQTRRELLRHAALVLGVAALSPAVSKAILAQTGTAPAEGTSQTLRGNRWQLVKKLCDIIIPSTDTAGACEAGVPLFLDLLVTESFLPDHRDRFLAGLDEIDEHLKAQGFASFLQAEDSAQNRVIRDLDREAFATGSSPENPTFFREFKELVLVGYYSSEVGATEELVYAPVPGAYHGCTPLASIGRAWATG